MATSTNSIGRIAYSTFEILGAFICLLITTSLIHKLFFNEKNISTRQSQSKHVMQPTYKMKLCAITCGIVLFFGFIMRSLIISSVINGHNMPSLSVQILDHFGKFLMDLGQSLYFKYVVLSIRKLYRSNSLARKAISKPIVIATEFLIVFNISVSVIYTVLIIYADEDKWRNLIIVIYTICNLLCCLCIDFGLIYCLKSVIRNYASTLIIANDEYHLLLLMMTRYCSLIIISASIDCLYAICILFEVFIGNNYFFKQHILWTILNGMVELIDVSTYIIAIYFSFSINNLIYEKYCFCCHNAIYGGAQHIINKSQSTLAGSNGNEYILMGDVVNNNENDLEKGSIYNGRNSHSSKLIHDIERQSVHSVESGQSSRRETNYFDDDLYIK